MLLEFVATISAGVGAGGMVLAIQKLTKNALPKWAMPAAAGAAMIGFNIWVDYSWFGRAQEGLGADKIVATQIEDKQFWRPWTYAAPVTTRFIALDKAAVETDGALVLTDMYLLSRRTDGAVVPVLFDCLLHRRTDALGMDGIPPETALAEIEWFTLTQNDPLLRTACDQLR